MKILIIAGGSGGHIMPAVAVAKVLLAKKQQVLLVGSNSKLDRELLTKSKLPFKQIICGKLRRYWDWHNLLTPWQVFVGIWQSFKIINKFKPKVVFSKGGFVAVPVCLVAWYKRIPIVIHESDMAIGLANKITGKLATKRLSAWSMAGHQRVGLPVRSLSSCRGNPCGCPLMQGQVQDLPLLFGFFGSQGSEPLNQLFYPIAKELSKVANIVWTYGANNNPPKNMPKNIRLVPFLHEEFTSTLQAADLVITRAGSSIFELAAAKKASILVPLPSAANNHQWYNAKKISKKKAAIVLDQEQLTSRKLLKIIIKLLADKEKRGELSRNITQFYQPKAAEKIAEIILAAN